MSRTRSISFLSVLLAGSLITGCGGGRSSSTIAPGNENSANNKLITVTEQGSATSNAATVPAATPKSGPLSRPPTILPPAGPLPRKLLSKDLIIGTGPEAKAGDTVTLNVVSAFDRGGKVHVSSSSWESKRGGKAHVSSSSEVFTLGKGRRRTWEQAIVGMKVGGRRELIFPVPGAHRSGHFVFMVDLLGI